MITSEYIDYIVLGFIDAALAIWIVLMILSARSSSEFGSGMSDTGDAGAVMEYEKNLPVDDLQPVTTLFQIDELEKKDPNALYSVEAYDKAADMLRQTVNLREQSARGQLNGTIIKESLEQRKIERQGVILKNGLQYVLSFLLMIDALLGVRSYRGYQ